MILRRLADNLRAQNYLGRNDKSLLDGLDAICKEAP